MGLKFDVVTGANVYIGDNSQYGRALEVSGADVKLQKADHAPIGMFGKKKVVVGLELIELDITWDFIHEDLNLMDQFDFTIRGNVVRRENGSQRSFPVVIECSGSLDNNDFIGSLKGQEWKGQKTKLTLDYLKVSHDGVEILEIDIDNNIFIENGVDRLEEMRTNAGL